MLYPYRLALEKTFPLSPSLVEASPTDRLLRLVCSGARRIPFIFHDPLF